MLLYSCLGKKSDNIIIKGNVKNIPATKLYLTDAYYWKVFLDSTDYKNDTFSFHINPKNFEPYIASIYFIDSEGKQKPLLYKNDFLSTDSTKYSLAGFVLDKGITTISGSYIKKATRKNNELRITGNRQNIPYFKTQLINFGRINTKNKIKRKQVINRYKNLIKQYPYSYYFIIMLYNHRLQYSKKELENLLVLFNNGKEMQHFKGKFIKYFKQLHEPGTPIHNYAFKDTLNRHENIISNSSELNMLIFWASWCGPCKKEIPELKKIYTEYKNKGIHMVSISIDENKKSWRTQLQKENMEWDQLIVSDSLLDKVRNYFNLNGIPLIIFTDSRGVEIERFLGYEESQKENFQNIIKKYLEN